MYFLKLLRNIESTETFNKSFEAFRKVQANYLKKNSKIFARASKKTRKLFEVA